MNTRLQSGLLRLNRLITAVSQAAFGDRPPDRDRGDCPAQESRLSGGPRHLKGVEYSFIWTRQPAHYRGPERQLATVHPVMSRQRVRGFFPAAAGRGLCRQRPRGAAACEARLSRSVKASGSLGGSQQLSWYSCSNDREGKEGGLEPGGSNRTNRANNG